MKLSDGKTTKNGSTFYKVAGLPAKEIFRRHLGIGKLAEVVRGHSTDKEETFADFPKSVGIFVHEKKMVFIAYKMRLNVGANAKPRIFADSKRFTISFKNGKAFIYKVQVGREQTPVANYTFKPEALVEFLARELKHYDVKKIKHKIYNQVANLIFREAKKHGIFKKHPPKKVFKLSNVMLALAYPELIPFWMEGFNLNNIQNDQEVIKLFRSLPAPSVTRKFVEIKGKKKGLIREILEGTKLYGSHDKYLTTLPFYVARFFQGLLSEDHIQNVLKLTRSTLQESLKDPKLVLTTTEPFERGWTKTEQKHYVEGLISFGQELKTHNSKIETQAAGKKKAVIVKIPNPDTVRLKAFLANFKPETILSLWGEMLNFSKQGPLGSPQMSMFDLRDAARQWFERKEEISLDFDFRGLKELHDHISRLYRNLKDKDFQIEVTERCASVEKIPVSEKFPAEIVFPRSRYQLNDWGHDLSHCIASYSERARRKELLLIGVVNEGKLLYTLEVDKSGRLVQFRGKHNASAPKEHQEPVMEFLSKNGITGERRVRVYRPDPASPGFTLLGPGDFPTTTDSKYEEFAPWEVPLEKKEEEEKGVAHG
jgi:hypothetical protein